MINVANMETNNPLLILSAMLLNGVVWVAGALVALIEWLAPVLLAVLFAAVGLVAKHWRIVAMVAGLALAVVVVVAFWQVLLVGAGVFGGMVAGLKLVMLHR